MGEENTSSNNNAPFRFEYGEKGDVLVARFHGKIGAREVPALEKWAAEIEGKDQKLILLDFAEVESCMPATYIFFANFQKKLRDGGKILGLCALNKEVKSMLLAAGVIRESELFENLPTAWHQLEPKLKAIHDSPSPDNGNEDAA